MQPKTSGSDAGVEGGGGGGCCSSREGEAGEARSAGGAPVGPEESAVPAGNGPGLSPPAVGGGENGSAPPPPPELTGP